jgi:hypothetical protein
MKVEKNQNPSIFLATYWQFEKKISLSKSGVFASFFPGKILSVV